MTPLQRALPLVLLALRSLAACGVEFLAHGQRAGRHRLAAHLDHQHASAR